MADGVRVVNANNYGIYGQGSNAYALMQNTVISNAGVGGLSLQGASNFTFINLTVNGTLDCSLWLQNDNDSTFINTTITTTGPGGCGIGLASSGTASNNNLFINTLLNNNPWGLVASGNSTANRFVNTASAHSTRVMALT